MQSLVGSPAWREIGLLIFSGIILTVIAFYIPLFQPITSLLLPLVFAFLVRKHHLISAFLSLLLVMVITYLIIGNPLLVFSISIEAGVIGLAIGLLFKNQISSGKSILIIIVLSAVMAILLITLTYIVSGMNPFALEKEILNEVYQNNRLYTEINALSPEEQQQLDQQIQKFIGLMVVLVPGSTVIWSIIKSFLVYLLANKMFYRLGYKNQQLTPFRKWQYPWYVIWGVIIGLIFLLAGDEWDIILLTNLGKNIIYVMSFLFTVLGISVFTYFIKKWNAAAILKGLVIFMVCLYWPLGLGLVLTMGLLDPILNLRQISAEDGQGGKK